MAKPFARIREFFSRRRKPVPGPAPKPRNARLEFSGSREDAALRIIRSRAQDRGYSVSDWAARERVTGPKMIDSYDEYSRLRKDGWIGAGWPKNRDLNDYGSIFGFAMDGSFKKAILKEIRLKSLRRKGQINVLDVGCGHINALEELALGLKELPKKARERVSLEGLTLARPLGQKELEELPEKFAERRSKNPSETHGKELGDSEKPFIKHKIAESGNFRKMAREHNIRVRIGLAETYSYGKKFDIIFSAVALRYTINPRQALTNTLAHLNTGGKAFLELRGWTDWNAILKKEKITPKELIDESSWLFTKK
jgi:SAM-dependent methyltransferase